MNSKRLFVGVKISRKLDRELDNPAPGTEGYRGPDHVNYLQTIDRGEDKFIGRYVEDGISAAEIENVSREISNNLKDIIPGHRVQENSLHIYALDESFLVSPPPSNKIG